MLLSQRMPRSGSLCPSPLALEMVPVCEWLVLECSRSCPQLSNCLDLPVLHQPSPPPSLRLLVASTFVHMRAEVAVYFTLNLPILAHLSCLLAGLGFCILLGNCGLLHPLLSHLGKQSVPRKDLRQNLRLFYLFRQCLDSLLGPQCLHPTSGVIMTPDLHGQNAEQPV